jgi:hypothetical protein
MANVTRNCSTQPLFCLSYRPEMFLLRLLTIRKCSQILITSKIFVTIGLEFSIRQTFASSSGAYPSPNEQWIEDRFWIWVHYGTGKVARGELFEALDFISYLRGTVLAPLGLLREGYKPSGVRKIEQFAPALAEALRGTVALHEQESCYLALERCIEIYRSLRSATVIHCKSAEEAAVSYLKVMRTSQV